MKLTTATIAAYVTLQNASGIKVGDTVKVVRAAKDNELGWDNVWIPEMTLMVGTTFSVLEVSGGRGIAIEDENGDYYQFPFFVLEMVKPKIPNTKIIKIDDGLTGAFDVVLKYFNTGQVIITVNEREFRLSEWKTVGKEADAFRKLHQSNK